MRINSKNKRGETGMNKIIAWVLAILVVVSLIFLLMKFPAITEKIVGIFDGILILFGIGDSSDGELKDGYMILGEQREVILDDGTGRCVVEIDGLKYALNYNEGGRLEVYGHFFEITQSVLSNYCKYIFIYNPVGKYMPYWLWTVVSLDGDFDINSFQPVSQKDIITDSRTQKCVFQGPIERQGYREGLIGKNLEEGIELLRTFGTLSEKEEWKSFNSESGVGNEIKQALEAVC